MEKKLKAMKEELMKELNDLETHRSVILAKLSVVDELINEYPQSKSEASVVTTIEIPNIATYKCNEEHSEL